MKKILTIDGGGTRGIIPATILSAIEEHTGIPIREQFDLIAGTSTGGIIAIGLAMGIAAKDIEELYLKKSKAIFADNNIDNFKDFGKTFGADYSQNNLKKILKKLFKNATLGDIDQWAKSQAKDFALMVPSFDLAPENFDVTTVDLNYRPKVFSSINPLDTAYFLYDIGCATSAGPTYFPIYISENLSGAYIDGGVAINHPAISALALAVNKSVENGIRKGLGWDIDSIKILSLGTGTSNMNKFHKEKLGDGDWGNYQWIKYLPDLLVESNMQASEYYVKNLLPNSELNYFRIQHNLQAISDDKVIALDNKDDKVIQQMRALAISRFRSEKVKILAFWDV